MSTQLLRFEHPGWLALLVLVPIAWSIARRAAGTMSATRRWCVFALRAVVIALVTAALAEPSWVRRGEDLTVVVVADASRSVPQELALDAEEFLRLAAEARERPEDRLAVVTTARKAEVAALPEPSTVPAISGHAGADDATNLAEGMKMALAILPSDSAARILLVSDGNETADRVLEAAELARANGVAVDVLPLRYRRDGEVVFEELRVPTRARRGQTVDLRMFLRSGRATTGRLSLLHDDRRIDLDPGSPGDSMTISLEPGVNAFSVPLPLEAGGAHRFRAVFEPTDASADAVAENNVATGVTFVSGEGRVLVLDAGGEEGEALAAVLRERGLDAERRGAESLAGSAAATISGFDAVVLANLPRWSIDVETDRFLKAYVHDLGGGLLMVGGDRSFGAGGWIDSETAKAIPVRMDPPQERQFVRGVLGLIMHSCEMAEGNYWSEVVAISAIEALTPQDFVGIITFSWEGGSSWAFPLQAAGDKSRPIAAARRMQVGDMPEFGPSMQVFIDGLEALEADGEVRFGQRHAIIISDGDPLPPDETLVQRFIDADITVTTIMVAGHGSPIDRANMERLATFTGGRFYEVTDPNSLPEIFIKEAVVVSRSLIVEGEAFVPSIAPDAAGPLRSVRSVPPLRGYVLTVPREDLARVSLVRSTESGGDPIYAWWNHGTGRAVAFTSDFSGRWGREWLGWSGAATFWEETLRWLLRPSSPDDLVLRTRIEGDEAVVEVESLDSEGAGRGFLRAEGRIVSPDGTVSSLALRQSGPGRSTGRFPLSSFGSYLVSVALPGEGGTRGTIQGAVTVPYAREFLAVRDNAALLRTVAERTGGRVLEMGDPRLADLFLREEMVVPLAPRRVWDLLVLVALGLFLLDVAVRRVSLEPSEVLAPFAWLAGRRAAPSEGAVEAWQRARARSSRDAAKAAGDAGDAAKGSPTSGGGRVRAAPTGSRAAANAGDAAASGEAPAAPAKPTPTTPPKEEPSGPESPTSRLLRAKRRGRDEGGTR